MTETSKIDLLTTRANGDIVLSHVEEELCEAEQAEPGLRCLQVRIHNGIDAALDGHVAARHPQTIGNRITIRVDAFDTPRAQTVELLERFMTYIVRPGEIRRPLLGNAFVSELDLDYLWTFILEGRAQSHVRKVKCPLLSRLTGWCRGAQQRVEADETARPFNVMFLNRDAHRLRRSYCGLAA